MVVNIIMDAFQHHAYVDVIYIDFSKTFDRVDNWVLLRYIDESGFGDSLLV